MCTPGGTRASRQVIVGVDVTTELGGESDIKGHRSGCPCQTRLRRPTIVISFERT